MLGLCSYKSLKIGGVFLRLAGPFPMSQNLDENEYIRFYIHLIRFSGGG